MKKNNKTNKIVILSIIGLLLLVCVVIFILNYTKDSSSFSLLEKNWINNHKSNVIDVSVYNDVPVYGQDGEGMIFSYLEEFTNSYGIEFNKVSYLVGGSTNMRDVSFRILNYNEEPGENDILLYTDKNVLIGKNDDNINGISSLRDKAIGVLEEDTSNVRYYLNEAVGVKYTSCKDTQEMIDLLNQGEISYGVVPNNLYLDDIIENDLSVVFHLDELYKKYVLTVNNDKTLKSIMNKFTMIYQKDFEEEKYKTYFLDAFLFGRSSQSRMKL